MRAIRIRRGLAQISLLFCIFSIIPHISFAQSPDGCPTVSDSSRDSVRDLYSLDDSVRIDASRQLLQRGAFALPALIEQIQLLPDLPISRWSADQVRRAVQVSTLTASILAMPIAAQSSLSDRNNPINAFRACDSDKVIKPLVWASRGVDRTLRISATNILSNVLDNTTVCFALHHLLDETISDDGRVNLLVAAGTVASYSYSENVNAFDFVFRGLTEIMSRKFGDFAQTKRLLDAISFRLLSDANKGRNLPPELSRYCKGFDFLEPIPTTG